MVSLLACAHACRPCTWLFTNGTTPDSEAQIIIFSFTGVVTPAFLIANKLPKSFRSSNLFKVSVIEHGSLFIFSFGTIEYI